VLIAACGGPLEDKLTIATLLSEMVLARRCPADLPIAVIAARGSSVRRRRAAELQLAHSDIP